MDYNLFDNISYIKPIYFWTINNFNKYEKIITKKSFYDLGIITDKAYYFIDNHHE